MRDDYFKKTATDNSISGDDVNRRRREARLGHAAPSKDWEQCHVVIHCIYKGQVPTKTLLDVILWNFLPNCVLGFVADSIVGVLALTEDTDDGQENDGNEETCENCLHRTLGLSGEPCSGCFASHEWEPMANENEKTCTNCEHKDVRIQKEPCLECFDKSAWQQKTANPWKVHPNYPVEDWQDEVSANDTRLGYKDWVDHQIESNKSA